MKRRLIKLNRKQIEFLLGQGYIDSKCLDAPHKIGWQDYFIDNFDWSFDMAFNPFGFNDVLLQDKTTKEVVYDPMINLQGNDLMKLLNL